MLIQFLVENFRSYEKETLINMLPSKRGRIHPEHILRSEEKGKKVSTLPLAVFYGANASGKSNLVRALKFAQTLVVKGTQGKSTIEAVPFRLTPEKMDKPSRFEFVVKHQDVIYTYGFAVTSQEVKEEWLFANYKRQESKLFERITEDGKVRLVAGKKLASSKEEKQRLQFIAEGTRPNQLFLTESNERNVGQLKPLMEWFQDHLNIILPDSRYSSLVLEAYKDEHFLSFITDFLKLSDTGIHELKLKAKDIDIDKHFAALSDSFKKELIDDLSKAPSHAVGIGGQKEFFTLLQDEDKSTKLLGLDVLHKGNDGKIVKFDAKDESDGTHRMMNLAPALLDMQSSENVYVIDEIDRSLHPLLCRFFIEAFLRGVTEKKTQSQIILTTHNTCLLDLGLLRRDEIWFVEKDNEGSSRLSSLSDFKYPVRADLKVAKGYLNGRFGAIPFLGDIRQLFKSKS